MKFKKTISPVVATALLLVVAVISVVGFQNWFGTFSSQIFTKVETQSNNNANIQIETLTQGFLYLKNTGTQNITINSIKVENTTCNINLEYDLGISEIDLTSCLESFEENIYEIVVYTNNGIFSEKILLKEYSIPPITDPYFSNVVYLSNFEIDSSDVKGNTVTLYDNAYVSNGTLLLDSLDDYVKVTGTNTNLTIGNQSFVMEAFFSTNAVYNGASFYPYIIGNEDAQGGNGGFMLYYDNGLGLRLMLNGVGHPAGTIFLADETLFQADTKHHIAIVGNSTHMYFYFDGNKVANASINYDFVYNQVNLGLSADAVGFNRPPAKKFYAARLTIGTTRGYDGPTIVVPSDPFLEN